MRESDALRLQAAMLLQVSQDCLGKAVRMELEADRLDAEADDQEWARSDLDQARVWLGERVSLVEAGA